MALRTLLGVLTPSSNTRLEPLTARMLQGLPVTAHFSRFRVVDVGLAAAGQFDSGPVVAAAELLADARVDSIVWSGTSGGWRGIEADRLLCDEITTATGIVATTSTLALLAGLERLGAHSLGLVTPYPRDMHDAVVGTLAAEGLDVVSSAQVDVTRFNWELALIAPATVAGMVSEVAGASPDAITTFCTNLAVADHVEAWEQQLGIPVLDSVTLAVWHGLVLAGYEGPLPAGWGRLFDVVGM